MIFKNIDEENVTNILNEISDFSKHEALRYIVMGKDEELLAICKIYETCSINPDLADFIKLFNTFLITNKKRRVDLFKWELFCIEREIPMIKEDLKRNVFKLNSKIVAT